jgi:hypothetical protein
MLSSYSQWTVNPEEIKPTRFTGQPARFPQNLSLFPRYHPAITLFAEVQPGQELACGEFVFI